jgi:hypothetical protein
LFAIITYRRRVDTDGPHFVLSQLRPRRDGTTRNTAASASAAPSAGGPAKTAVSVGGAALDEKSGDERYGASPFDEKQKFYANSKTGAWYDHLRSTGGHVPQFFERIAKEYAKDLDDDRLRELAEDPGLPLSSFRPWELGWDGQITRSPFETSMAR